MVIDIVLLVLHIIFVIMTILFVIFGVYEQMYSPEKVLKFLRKMHINLKYYQVMIIGLLSAMLAGATYILRAKLAGTL